MGTALSTNVAGALIQSTAEPNAARLAASASAGGVRLRGGEGQREGINPSATGLEEGSVNGPAAAFRTIERGVESARQVVPNVEDILEIQQERIAESEAARQAQLEEARVLEQEQAQDTELLVPDPAAGTERFSATNAQESNVQTLRNEAADIAQPRDANAAPDAPSTFAGVNSTGELLNIVV